MKKIEFICSLPLKGKVGGELVKNEYLVNYFKEKFKINLLDFEKIKKNNFLLFFFIIKSLFNFNSKEIYISKSSYTAYKYLKIAKFLNVYKKKIKYFVIGSALDKIIVEENYDINIYKNIDIIYVETTKLKTGLNNLGILNVEKLSNFKKFKIREYKSKKIDLPIKAVFFSRIVPEKGVDMIFEMVKEINKDKKMIEVDFYGPIEETYKNKFNNQIEKYKETKYLGILDSKYEKTYEILESYDLMLFPTYWEGEGFAGTIIDSFISGVPILASNWNSNSEIVNAEKTGFIFEAKNQLEFNKQIKKIIENKEILDNMRRNCYEESKKYEINRVLNKVYR